MEQNNCWRKTHNNSKINSSESIENVNALPKKYKLDLDTPMETFLFWMIIIGGFTAFLGVIYYLDGETNARALFSIGVVVAALSGVLYKATDNYYIIDADKKMMLYQFKCFTINNLEIFAPFSSIHAITVNGRRQHTKSTTWWEYRAEMVLSSGKVYPISEWKKYAFEETEKKARNMADITGAEFVKTSEEDVCIPARGPKGKYTFKKNPAAFFHHFKQTLLHSLKVLLVIAGVGFFMLIAKLF
ncbi:MAG: hypothetical protein ACQETH_13550 [Candidatus Rifleibacteriota bacterium]